MVTNFLQLIKSIFQLFYKNKFYLLLVLLTIYSTFFFKSNAVTSSFAIREGNFLSIIPPLLAFSIAIFTKNIILSLSISIFLGSFLFIFFQSKITLSMVVYGFFNGFSYLGSNIFNYGNLLILTFIILILAATSVVVYAGGFQGIMNSIFSFAKSRRSVEILTVVSGLIIFIDDYVNTIVVGSSFKPLADRFRISRAKLAFLVDATSAPVAGLAFISTWIGYEAGLFEQMAGLLSINSNGYSMFLDALPFRFYCFIMIVFVFLIAYFNVDFGPMKKAEEQAKTKSNDNEKNAEQDVSAESGKILSPEVLSQIRVSPYSAIIPISILFIVLICGFWIDGNGIIILKSSLFNLFSLDTWRQTITQSRHIKEIFFISAASFGMAAFLCANFLAKLKIVNIFKVSIAGTKSAVLPVLILILAWSLKSLLTDLKAGAFIVSILGENISPYWFPPLVFLIAGVLSFFTGTSYGTMGILIPLVVPVAFNLDGSNYGFITMISMGAVLDGAIFGDHCSPISDTTVMSSISCGCEHLHHVRTQLPYSILVAAIALFLGYLPASFVLASGLDILHLFPWITVLVSAIVIFILFKILQKRNQTKSKREKE